MKKIITALLLCLSVPVAAQPEGVTAVEGFKLDRYLGKWYEIASYPAWFQKGCVGSTADYSLLDNGKIQVVNRCHKDSLDGPLKESKGKAEVVNTTTHAELKVWFFWPFKGDYWIIDLDPEECWLLGPIEGRLAHLQSGRDDGEMRRVPLRSLFARRIIVSIETGPTDCRVSERITDIPHLREQGQIRPPGRRLPLVVAGYRNWRKRLWQAHHRYRQLFYPVCTGARTSSRYWPAYKIYYRRTWLLRC